MAIKHDQKYEFKSLKTFFNGLKLAMFSIKHQIMGMHLMLASQHKLP
jgi:hypothetical protein